MGMTWGDYGALTEGERLGGPQGKPGAPSVSALTEEGSSKSSDSRSPLVAGSIPAACPSSVSAPLRGRKVVGRRRRENPGGFGQTGCVASPPPSDPVFPNKRESLTEDGMHPVDARARRTAVQSDSPSSVSVLGGAGLRGTRFIGGRRPLLAVFTGPRWVPAPPSALPEEGRRFGRSLEPTAGSPLTDWSPFSVSALSGAAVSPHQQEPGPPGSPAVPPLTEAGGTTAHDPAAAPLSALTEGGHRPAVGTLGRTAPPSRRKGATESTAMKKAGAAPTPPSVSVLRAQP